MSKTYRWGILGPGRIAEKFCMALASVEGATVQAVASRDAGRAAEFAKDYHAQSYYGNYNDLISDPEVDIIYIATPHPFHFDQTIACLSNKKAVLCEKPLSMNSRHTSEMIATANANNVFLMEGMWTACMPVIQKVRELVNNDAIGKLQFLAADFGFAAPQDREGRLLNKALGGGAVLDIGVYPISLATLLLGEPVSIKSVSRLTDTSVDEYMNVVLQYEQGETASLFSTIAFNTPIEATLVGTKGHIKIHNPWFKGTDLTIYPESGKQESFSIPHLCNGFEYEIMEVMNCLEKGALQSDIVTHQVSATVSRIMDEILSQAGVSYDE